MTRSVVLVVAFAAAGGAARVLQDAVLAWRYGTDPLADAYYFLFNLVNWPAAVAISAFATLFVPLEASLRARRNDAEMASFRSEQLGAVLLMATLAGPLAWWVCSVAVRSEWAGLDAGARAVAMAGLPYMAAAVPFGLLAALYTAWMVSGERREATLLEALPPLALSAALLTLPGVTFFAGLPVGLAVQAIVMVALLRAAHVRPRLRFSSSAWRGLATGASILVGAQLLMGLAPAIDAFLSARLGEGIIAAMNYANRLLLGVQGLAALAIQRVALPWLARVVAESPHEVLRSSREWFWRAALVGSVAALGVCLLADFAVAVLFERGRFTASDREAVVSLLRWGTLQLVPFVAGLTLVTALAARRAYGAIGFAAAGGVLVKLATSVLCLNELGAIGLQLGTAAMYVASAGLCWAALAKDGRMTGA